MQKPATLFLVCLGMTVLIGSADMGQGVKLAFKPFFCGYAVPLYPGLTHLCHQRISSKETGQNLVWDGFASPASTATIIKFYKRKLGFSGSRRTKQVEHGHWKSKTENPR